MEINSKPSAAAHAKIGQDATISSIIIRPDYVYVAPLNNVVLAADDEQYSKPTAAANPDSDTTIIIHNNEYVVFIDLSLHSGLSKKSYSFKTAA
jgi:hypothetical protein